MLSLSLSFELVGRDAILVLGLNRNLQSFKRVRNCTLSFSLALLTIDFFPFLSFFLCPTVCVRACAINRTFLFDTCRV